MLVKSRKCLLLDDKASGQPITGQNILLLLWDILLRLLPVDPAPEAAEATEEL